MVDNISDSSGQESEQTLGDDERQRNLAHCSL